MGDTGITAQTLMAKSKGPRMLKSFARREVCSHVFDLRGHDLEEISSGLWRPETLHPGGETNMYEQSSVESHRKCLRGGSGGSSAPHVGASQPEIPGLGCFT